MAESIIQVATEYEIVCTFLPVLSGATWMMLSAMSCS